MVGKIIFNGKEYDSIDAMPVADRREYEAAMAAVRGHGGLFKLLRGNISLKVSTDVKTDYVVNGTRYASLEEMPPHIRQAFDKAAASGVSIKALHSKSHAGPRPVVPGSGLRLPLGVVISGFLLLGLLIWYFSRR